MCTPRIGGPRPCVAASGSDVPCFHPLHGFWSRDRHPGTGKRRVVFNPRLGFVDRPVTVPCGQCVGCRLKRSREWAVRCIHEAQMHEDNCFITLTYNDAHLPKDGSLVLSDYQKFMKRLRKANGPDIRFFHCGEYGSQFGRPHYHAILFNFDFPDKRLFKTERGIPLFTSEKLQELWPFGFSTIGGVTFESAAYVARYVLKKVTGDDAASHYNGRAPEYVTMSRRPGIGRGWLDRFGSEVWDSDEVIIDGRRLRPPRYYDRVLELEDETRYLQTKAARLKASKTDSANQTPRRLADRETVTKARVSRLKRTIE